MSETAGDSWATPHIRDSIHSWGRKVDDDEHPDSEYEAGEEYLDLQYLGCLLSLQWDTPPTSSLDPPMRRAYARWRKWWERVLANDGGVGPAYHYAFYDPSDELDDLREMAEALWAMRDTLAASEEASHV